MFQACHNVPGSEMKGGITKLARCLHFSFVLFGTEESLSLICYRNPVGMLGRVEGGEAQVPGGEDGGQPQDSGRGQVQVYHVGTSGGGRRDKDIPVY